MKKSICILSSTNVRWPANRPTDRSYEQTACQFRWNMCVCVYVLFFIISQPCYVVPNSEHTSNCVPMLLLLFGDSKSHKCIHTFVHAVCHMRAGRPACALSSDTIIYLYIFCFFFFFFFTWMCVCRRAYALTVCVHVNELRVLSMWLSVFVVIILSCVLFIRLNMCACVMHVYVCLSVCVCVHQARV